MKRRNFLLMLFVLPAVLTGAHALAKDSGGSRKGGGSTKSGGSSSHRSAKTGRYVEKGYADKHPSTTVKEKRK